MNARKVALVTGSATGAAPPTALALARRGYDVLITTRRASAGERDRRTCHEAGADTLCVRADVALDIECRSMVQAAFARWNRLDTLVNNAGITTFAGSGNWDALDAGTFQRIFAVNLLGTFQMVRAAVPHLKAARGSIVNISSIAGGARDRLLGAIHRFEGGDQFADAPLARVLAPECG